MQEPCRSCERKSVDFGGCRCQAMQIIALLLCLQCQRAFLDDLRLAVPDNLGYVAVNGKFLFGSDNIATDDGRNISSYLIESNGALKYLGAKNIRNKGTGNSCNDGSFLTLDHNGQYLYPLVLNTESCNGVPAYQSWSINQTSSTSASTGTWARLSTSARTMCVVDGTQVTHGTFRIYMSAVKLFWTARVLMRKGPEG